MVPMWSLAIERGTTLRQRSVLDSGRAVGRPCDATGRGTTTERSVLEGVRRSTETVRDACDTPLTHGKGQRSVSHHPSSSVGLQQSSSPKRVRSAWPRRRAEPRGKSAESMTPSARGEASKGEFYPPGLQDLTRLRVRFVSPGEDPTQSQHSSRPARFTLEQGRTRWQYWWRIRPRLVAVPSRAFLLVFLLFSFLLRHGFLSRLRSQT